MMRREEDMVQRAVVQHLQFRRRKGVSFFAVPNGGGRSAKEAAIMQGLGVRAGVPDIILIADGRTYGLEIKRAKGGRVSPGQQTMMAEIEQAGGTCAVAEGLDAALALLERWGILRTGKNPDGKKPPALGSAEG